MWRRCQARKDTALVSFHARRASVGAGKVPSPKRHSVVVFSCSACMSGHRKDAEHEKTPVLVSFRVRCASVDEKCQARKDTNAGVFWCSADPPSRVSSEEGDGVVGKSPPPLENRDAGRVLATGTLHLVFRVREGCCAVAHQSQGVREATGGFRAQCAL